MRNFTLILVFFSLITCSRSAWVIEDPIDYTKLKLNSDLCGLVHVSEVKDTGRAKEIYGDGVKYREVVLKLEILSLFKGEQKKGFTLSIYRVPTKEELAKDGDPNPSVKNLNLSVSEVNHLYLVEAVKGDTLLVYLSGDSKNGFTPVTGLSKLSHSVFCIEPSSLIRSKTMLKQTSRN